MKKSLTLLTALALALAPGGAAAKELTRATVCGVSGCTTITDAGTLEALPLGADRPSATPAPAAYYTVDFTIDHGDAISTFRVLHAPVGEVLGANGERAGGLTWLPVSGDAIGAMHGVTSGLEPFPRPGAWPAAVGDSIRAATAAPGFTLPLVSHSPVIALALGLGAALCALLLARRVRAARARPA